MKLQVSNIEMDSPKQSAESSSALGLLWAAGFAFWRALMGGQRGAHGGGDGVDNEHAAQLGEHLTGRFEAASIEELMAELDWPEEPVVRGLRAGVKCGHLVEELDLDSGHWTYAAAPPPDVRSSAARRGRRRDVGIPDKLLKLSRLRTAGVVSEQEFQMQKTRLLQ